MDPIYNDMRDAIYGAQGCKVNALADALFTGLAFLPGADEGAAAADAAGTTAADAAATGAADGAVSTESLDSIANGDRIGSALKRDAYHNAPSWVDPNGIAVNGQEFSITGGDGVIRTLVQSPATVNSIAGRVEWLINSDGTIGHQLFVEGGSINGVPTLP